MKLRLHYVGILNCRAAHVFDHMYQIQVYNVYLDQFDPVTLVLGLIVSCMPSMWEVV